MEFKPVSPVVFCPTHGIVESCPICGSKLAEVKYKGHKRSVLIITKREGFVALMGCLRVKLHDKVVNGVSYRDRVFVRPLLKKRRERSDLSFEDLDAY